MNWIIYPGFVGIMPLRSDSVLRNVEFGTFSKPGRGGTLFYEGQEIVEVMDFFVENLRTHFLPIVCFIMCSHTCRCL